MFTGLVTETGTVRAREPIGGAAHAAGGSAGSRLVVATRLATQLAPGDSVAVSGVCLTVTDAAPDSFAAEVMRETLERSTLGSLRGGARVNIELPVRAGDRLGGHFVQGHVDATGTVQAVAPEGIARRVVIRSDEELTRYIADKGSVAVDGVSLTAIAPAGRSFEVSLVPETLERTTLGDLTGGEPVNLEVDLLAKYVERLTLRAGGEPATVPAVGTA